MLHRMLALVVLGLLASCTGTRHSLGLPAEQIAVVKGSSYNPVQMLGVNTMIVIQAVDGQELKHEVVEVLPGHHTLEIFYGMYIDNTPGPNGKATLELDAVAGKTYRIRERFGSGGEIAFDIVEEAAR